MFIQRVNIFLLCLVVSLSPAYVYANTVTSLGGWSPSSLISQGASTLVNASKNVLVNGVNLVKNSTALIRPSPSQVSKILKGGGYGLALGAAVTALLGAVDWVLDPANNRIKYKPITPTDSPPDNSAVYGWAGKNHCTSVVTLFSSQQGAADHVCNHADCNARPAQTAIIQTTDIKCNPAGFTMPKPAEVKNPNYDPAFVPEYQYLPLDVVSARVITNADANNSDAKNVTLATASQIVTDAQEDSNNRYGPYSPSTEQLINELESNSSIPTTETVPTTSTTTTNTQTNTQSTDGSFTLPAFCSWASYICDAMNTSNRNSNRAATASEKSNTFLNTMQGQLVTNGNKTDELKGAVVNAGSAANTAATELKGEVVNAASAANASAAELKGAVVNAASAAAASATELKGEVVNAASAAAAAASTASADSAALTAAVNQNTEAVKDKPLPAFCSWAAIVCDAAQVITSFPLTETVQEVRDWWKDPENPQPEKLDITPAAIPAIAPIILSGGGGCPTDSVTFNVMGQSVTLDMPYQPVCDALEFFRPAVLAVGAITSVFIASGIRSQDNN